MPICIHTVMTTSIQCVALISNKHAHCDRLHCQLKSTVNSFAQNCAATEEKSQPQKLNILITRRKKQVVTSPLKFTLQRGQREPLLQKQSNKKSATADDVAIERISG